MYSNNQQQQHQQQQQNLQPMQTFPKKMAKIKPMISQPSTESAEFIADDQLIKIRTPVRAVWRHKPIVHLLASSKESVSVEQVYISEDSGEPVAVCSADHASNPSPEAEELSVTEGSSFVIHTPSPSSSSSFVFQSQNNTQHAQKSDSKLPVQFYYHNDESESDYIVIHQANMESSQSRPNNEHSHHDETFIEDEECSGDDDLSEDELGEYIVTTSQNAPDDLLLDDEEDFYSSKKNKNSKQMINYFMHDIQQSGDNDQSEYLLTEPEELFENALEENQTKREIVYDFPIFVPPFGYGYLETIFEEDEDNDEIIGAQHDTRYSSSDSSDGSNQNAIAESLDDQSFNSDEVFMHDNSCSPEPTVEQFEEKPNLESKKRIKKRNDSGIKSHSSNESFASSHSSTSKVESLNSFTIGPHHQSEEELLSPNEDFGPEARSAHRKLLIGYQQHPQSPESQFFFFNGGPLQTPSSVEHLPEHFHQHLEESSAEAQQFLIPPPSNLGFSGSSTDGDNDQVTVQLANGESSCEHDQRGESPLYSTSSTTTTGCLIAAAEAEINQAAQEVITPSPSISNSTTVTTTSPTPTSNASEQSTTTEQYSSEQYSYPTISMATATLTSAVLGGASPIPGPFLLPGDEYYLQQMYSAGTAQTVPTFSTGQHSTSILLGNTAEQAVPSEYRRKDGSVQRSSRKGGGGGGGHRHRRKGAINLLESGSDQASDIAPLDLSPDGGSTEDVSTGTPSTRSALSSDSEISRSDLSDDSDEETDRGTIRRRVVVDKNNNNNSNSGSNEKMQQQMAAQPSSNSLDRNVGPNFKLKTAKNIWSPSSSSLASPGSPPNAALLNSTENSDLYSDQISVNTQVPTHSTGEEGAGAGHLLSLHFVSSPSNDPQFAHLHHHNHNHYPQHYQHQHQQYSQQLPPQFAQAPLSLADYQAAQQQQGLGHRQQQHHHHTQLNHHSSEVVPPPYSSATYEQFEQKQQAEQQQQQQRHLQQYLAQHPTEPPALFSSSTLPRSMTIMESGGGGAESALHSSVPHVAEVYQPRQHPTHKYWTLPRSIATGIPLPNGGPYIERPGGVPPGMVLSEADDVPISAMAAMDDVDRFNKHHEQLQQTRIKEIAEQHMKPIHSTTTTTTSGTTVQEEIAHGTQTVSTSTTSKHIIQHVVARDEPPHGATLLYETEDATFYTVPAPEGEDELDQGMQATSSTTVKTTTYAVPKKKLDEGIGPVNESGVPITPKAGVKSEHGSEWYKAWVRNMHKMERAGRDDSADSICVKVKSPRYKGTDYQLTVEGKRGPPKYVPGNIADYVPGHSSISEREKQIFYEDVFNYIDSIFAKVLAPTTHSANQYRSTLCKRAQSLSRMGSSGSPASACYAQPGSIAADRRSSGDYGTIQRPSRSMPSLLPDASFLLNQFFNYPPPPKHSPVPPPFDATLGRARRLSMPGKLGTSASSLSGSKKPTAKKSAKKTKKKLKKKKAPAINKPTSSEPTSSDQPDGGQGGGDGGGGGGASGSADGNLSDDEREDEDDDEKDPNHGGEEEGSEEDEEVVDSEEEDGKLRDDVSHEADVEDFFEENSLNTEKNGPELSGQPGTSSQLVAKAPTTTTSYYHEKCVFNTLTGQKQAPASVGSGSGYDSDSSYIIKKSKPKQSSTKPASPAVYRAVQRGEIDIPLGGLQRPAPPKQQPRREMEDYGDLETGENYVNGADEWNQLDEWQSQIETDFDYIYSTLQNVKAPGPSASTPYPLPTQRSSSLNVFSSVSRNVSPRTSTQLKSKTKKTVAFDDADEVQVIEEIEEVDDDIDNSFSISNATNKGIFEEEDDEVEEAEYSYGGLLRPGSHKPEGYAKSFEHYLNTQDLDKNVQRLKSLSGDDRVRVRKHRKRRSRSPGGSKSPLRNTPLPNSVDSDYDRLPPSYYSVRSSSNKTGYGGDSVQRTSSAAVYQPSQLNEGKINVQCRMPTNKLVAVDPMLDITAGSFTSTATGKNSGRYSYSGFMSPASMASTTVADSSFSTVVKQPTPTPRNVVLTSSLGKGPCGSEPYSMARHHYMPTAMSPVALDRYERAFADKENEPKKMARVIYDFHAQSRNELAVKKGDLVIVRKTVSLNWVEVEDSASGLVGLVPRSYLDFEQYGVARARYDFAAKTSVEISFKRGEKLTLLRRVDNNWYEGMNEKQDVGIFPVSYVEAIKQPIVLKSLEQQSACSPDSNAPHIHFSTDASREPGGGTTSQASSASSASLASIISIDNNRFGKADSYEHQYHHQHQHQQHQQHQQQLHSHPLHSTMMMTPSSMSPSPSGSMSISLGSLPQQYQSSSLSSVSSRPLPTPLCSHPPLSPVTANVPYHYSQQAQKEHEAALQKQAIYFSSTSSEPATYHHIRRAPEAIRHFGGCGERTCLPKAQIYRVIHPYKPQQIDEIELTYGDLLTVTTLCDDGWYLGRSTLSGKFGTFPGNYVEQV